MIIEHNEHPIERIMDNAFIKLKGLVSADTVVGNPVTTSDGVSIIPISRVTMGFLTGGGEYSDKLLSLIPDVISSFTCKKED